MNEEYRLSVVICAVDETFSLEKTFRKIDQYKEASEYLFVLSQTGSAECIETVKRICTREDCHWVFQSGKGFGNAIRDSFVLVHGTHMVVWSADEATDVVSFPTMVHLSKENPDNIIKISRWLQKDGFEGYGKLNKALNFISQRVFGLMFHSKLTEFTNPTQIAPVALYRSIRWKHNGFDFLPEMTFKPIKLGVAFIEVPTKNVPRQEGHSHNGIKEHLSYYTTIIGIFFTKKNRLKKEALE